MNVLDYIVMALYALMIIFITLWAMRRVDSTRDFLRPAARCPGGYQASLIICQAIARPYLLLMLPLLTIMVLPFISGGPSPSLLPY
ncbi:hypothetical protein QNH14_14910 [Apirhabdus apintestini]|nr:hypothetical protein QNH14_14910 [Enterobacteriaceae bacterium CA-0114]